MKVEASKKLPLGKYATIKVCSERVLSARSLARNVNYHIIFKVNDNLISYSDGPKSFSIAFITEIVHVMGLKARIK